MFILSSPELLTSPNGFTIHFDMLFTDEIVEITAICFTGEALSLLQGRTIGMSSSILPDKFSIKTEEAEHYLIGHLSSGSCRHLSEARTSEWIFIGVIFIYVLSYPIFLQLAANSAGLESEWCERPGGMT